MSQPELDLSAEKQNIYQLAVFSPDKFPDPSAGQQQLDAAIAAAPAGNQHQEEISNIYSAVYSGVPVFEIMCRGVAVMRRRSDSYLNATQILKVAGISLTYQRYVKLLIKGIDKGRRTKILEREIQSGSHEKVQVMFPKVREVMESIKELGSLLSAGLR